MLFADWSTTEVGGLLVGFAGVVTAIGTVAKSWIDSRHKNRLEAKAAEATEKARREAAEAEAKAAETVNEREDRELKNKERMEGIEAAVRHWSRIAAWQKGELDRQKAEIVQRDCQVKEVREDLDYCKEEHSAVREDMAVLYSHLERQHEFSERLATICRELKQDPGAVPEIPRRPPRPERQRAEAPCDPDQEDN